MDLLGALTYLRLTQLSALTHVQELHLLAFLKGCKMPSGKKQEIWNKVEALETKQCATNAMNIECEHPSGIATHCVQPCKSCNR